MTDLEALRLQLPKHFEWNWIRRDCSIASITTPRNIYVVINYMDEGYKLIQITTNQHPLKQQSVAEDLKLLLENN